MPTSNPKPASDFEKASQGALFALGGVVSFTAAPFVGACIGTLAYWQMQRRGHGLWESVGATYNLLQEGIGDLVVSHKQHFNPSQLVSNVLNQTPIGKLIELDLSRELKLDGSWMQQLITLDRDTERLRSFGVLGEPGDGKTYVLRYVIYHFIRQHPTGQVYIHDIDLARTVKKWGAGAWYGLPVGEVVYSDPEDFPRIVRTIANTIKQSGDDSPILLVVDEFNNLLSELEEKTRAKTVEQLNTIKNRGGKRLIQFALASQAADVEGLGLSQAFVRSLDWVVLKRSALTDGATRNMGLRSTLKQRFTELADKLEDLPTQFEGFRPCITYLSKELALTGVPDLSDLPYRLDIQTPQDAASTWLAQFLTEHPHLLLKVQDGEITSKTQLGNTIDPILKEKGERVLRRSDRKDERWAEISRRWPQLVTGEFPPENPALASCTDDLDLARPHAVGVSEETDVEAVPH